MNTKLKKEFDELLLSGQTLTEKEFETKVDNFLANKSEVEKDAFSEYFIEISTQKMQQYKDTSDEISVLKQLDGIEEYINLSKLSQSYFGKTKSWIYQRLHGYMVHGKPAKFTDTEKKTLSEALLNLSENLRNVALKIA